MSSAAADDLLVNLIHDSYGRKLSTFTPGGISVQNDFQEGGDSPVFHTVALPNLLWFTLFLFAVLQEIVFLATLT